MQSKADLEQFYATPDPWGYQTTKDDLLRRKRLLRACGWRKYERALDLGCGEGFVAAKLPARQIFGIELSDTAASRLPSNVTRIMEPAGKYDLIVAAGVLYGQYDHEQLTKWIMEHASGRVIVAGIKDWLIDALPKDRLKAEKSFKYRDYEQVIKVYQW